ncbi:FGGY carbohydrate kinase domain-containing protein isoform X5 [Columba livia]|uniref:FGGY carbohydrate kinase domain-containing protein n=1 Tax=Columba livia TaxID=8932 RepID=A0A2I0MBW0_COLLI|nr:FGGY carbohydrate kinase domain-containing protein isoform X4 [Columba livia]PKK27163.1 FGGY carbohydrate kinase domain containing, transcript variant X5 [Columba livia]
MHSEKQAPVKYYVGIDVGSASVRAALVDEFGTVVAHADRPIQIWEPQPDHYEQSSADIWAACCSVTKKVVCGVDASWIRGVGFDATCSLVVVDKQFQPLAVNCEGQNYRNVIMWMDHRAVSQVDRINATQHRVLSYVGGVMSVEMQPPKLLWIKENLQESCWDKAGYFFDLPDFLSWKATGVTARSLCTVVCKWTYTSDGGWDDSFWKMIGLEDLVKDKYEKIGNHVLSPGEPVGKGLTPEAAKDLGLPEGIAVAASLIDAHAGGLGVIGADVKGYNLPCENEPITSRVAMICGTSSCHMGVSETPIFVPGVWGPYFSAMVPGLWLNEGGQSATGKLLGTRHILETMQAAGHHINTLFLCGGLSKNPLFVQMHADITGKPVVLSKEVESVLVGAAILGACASGDFASIQEAMAKMGKIGRVVQPNHEHKRFYDKKYEVFLKLVEHQKEYRSIMNSV